MRLPGSQQVAYGKKFFESLPWTELKPMPEAAIWEASTKDSALGNWIWFPEGDPKRDAPVAARFFRKLFKLPEKPVKSATVRIAVDDQLTLWVNGKPIGAGSNWQAPERFDLTTVLQPGSNLLAVRGENMKAPVALNPAGLATVLRIEFTDGSSTNLLSDATWRTAQAEQPHWQEVRL